MKHHTIAGLASALTILATWVTTILKTFILEQPTSDKTMVTTRDSKVTHLLLQNRSTRPKLPPSFFSGTIQHVTLPAWLVLVGDDSLGGPSGLP